MSEQQDLAPKGARVDALRQIAVDLIEAYTCRCYTEDLASESDCPCGGSGRTMDGDDDPYEGCWVCQARSALADDESQQTAPAADPHPAPIPPAAGAAHVETGDAAPGGDDPS